MIDLNDFLKQLIQNVDERYLIAAIFGAVFLLVFTLLRAAIRLREKAQQKRMKPSANVIPMRRQRAPRKIKQRGLSPLWLVFLAAVLVVLFQSGITREFVPHEALTGRVTHVRDGDTIEVSNRPIRLNGLTCDERGTALGDQATAAMRRLVSGKQVTCTLNGDRTYDREVGRCSLEDGRDIGAIMIARGLCGRCARYDPLRKYVDVQLEAGQFSGAYPGYCSALW